MYEIVRIVRRAAAALRPLPGGAALLAAALPLAAAAEPVDISEAPAYPALVAPDAAGGPADTVLFGDDLVEVAVALGAADRILARRDTVDLPGIGDTPHQMSDWAGVEGIYGLAPAHVIGSSVIHEDLLSGLGALGVDTAMIRRTLPATEKVRRLAEILGRQETGETLVAAIEEDYAAIEKVTVDGHPPRLLHISKQGAGGNFSAGGAGTAVDNLIARVGGINTAAEIGQDRYRPVTPEGVIQMAPDAVLISEAELPAFGGLDGLWTAYPGLALTPAGRNGRAIVMRDLHVRQDAASSGIASRALSAALAEMFP